MKILVIRSCISQVFMKNLEKIHSEFQGCKVSALVQPFAKGEALQNPFVDEVIEYQGKKPRFGVLNSSLSFILDLRKRHFDLVIMMYNDLNGISYANVQILALAIASTRIKACNASGKIFSFREIYSIKAVLLGLVSGIFDHKIVVKLVVIFNSLYKNFFLTRERLQGFLKNKAGSH